MSARAIPIVGSGICKNFRRKTGEVVKALDDVSLEAGHGTLTALVGPDGAGKTTLIRLTAGLIAPDAGRLAVLGIDVAAHPQQVQDRIGYMPQKFGLYEDLSVQENLDLYADLHGVTQDERRERYPRLMAMTALGPFRSRLAGQLSGGMKQKLGLACALVCSPALLLLDEPTVGVDPLSRRELWEIILHLVGDQGLSVLLSTSYLDEAERCRHVIVLHEGKVLAQGAPAEITAAAGGRTFLARPPTGHSARSVQARLLDDPTMIDAVPEAGQVRFVRTEGATAEPASDAAARPLPAHDPARRLDADAGGFLLADLEVTPVEPRFEDGFMVLLRRSVAHEHTAAVLLDQPPLAENGKVAVEVRDLVRQFGAFTAVDHISFEVGRGQLFGLLGPNGAGKTTTFRMLCGLLPASAGTLLVAGVDLRFARAAARQRIGYVAQKFSLYGQLTVLENLDFFASAYGLRGDRKRRQLNWAMTQFELGALGHLPAGQLPGGYKQRLAMAAALLHEPDILFLDEPTSGADPLARREFWRRITALAEQGVTVIITTHFMEEAEYCDRVVIMDAGRLLAQGTPAEIRNLAPAGSDGEPSMEDAFIAVVQEARRAAPHSDAGRIAHDRP
jgi:ABC-2 type transport system ATP-binding protein